jgi:hypothetical protein
MCKRWEVCTKSLRDGAGNEVFILVSSSNVIGRVLRLFDVSAREKVCFLFSL